MQTTTLTVTQLVRDFSAYVNRVAYRAERFTLFKGSKPVAELRPVPMGRTLGELSALLRPVPALTPEEAESFAADIDDARSLLPQEGTRDPWLF